MRLIAILPGFIFALASLPASATVWDCTYTSFTLPWRPLDPKIQVHVQYRSGRYFVYELETENFPFRVLQNNEIALVAAVGDSFMGVEQGLTIGTRTLIIKKDTGELNLINGYWGSRGPKSSSTRGVCHQLRTPHRTN